MSALYLTFAATWVFIAVLLIFQPWMTRRNVLFGVVFGAGDIWEDPAARRLRQRYLAAMIPAACLATAAETIYFCIARPSETGATIPYFIGLAAMMAAATVIFVAFHARTRALKALRGTDPNLTEETITVETSLSDRQTVLRAGWLLLELPVLAAAYLVAFLGYSAMPEKIPVHYSFTQADAWAPKSWPVVLSPLLIGSSVILALLIATLFTRRAPASVRGNPDAAPRAFRFRKAIIFLLIGVGILTEFSFLLLEIGFLTPIPPLCFLIPLAASLLITVAIFWIYFRLVRVKKPKGPILDDDAKWVFGMFYFNPTDPSFFIEKRTGIGYTLNFARPGAWILFAGILLSIAAGTFFSTR